MKKSHLFLVVPLVLSAAPVFSAEVKDPMQTGQSIQKKVSLLKAQMERVSAIPKLMEEFEPLIRQGKMAEAESLVDHALQLLQEFKARPAD